MNKTLKSIDDGMKKAVSMLGQINENLKDLKHEVAKENQMLAKMNGTLASIDSGVSNIGEITIVNAPCLAED